VESEVEAELAVDGLAQLLQDGWICKDQESFVFASPFILYVASVQLFSSYQLDDKTSDFKEFLFMVLQKLDPTKLRESLGRATNDILLEHSWQMEFYRVASSCLGRQSHISPDVRHIFGSSGYIDFYVNGDKQWGIELTREGSKVQEHQTRFTGIFPYPTQRNSCFRFLHKQCT
jgi:hypothetical protein